MNLFYGNVHLVQGQEPLTAESYFVVVHERKKRQKVNFMMLCRKNKGEP